MAQRIYVNDTALIEADLLADDGVSHLGATTVSWTFKKPDGTLITGGPQSITESAVTLVISNTNLPGLYNGQITFVLSDSTRRSITSAFEVVDPLQVTGEWATPKEAVVDRAWMKLEDLFDSKELGGPWLREKTKNIVDREKLSRFLPDALYAINNVYQPVTGYDDATFPYAAHGPLLSQGLLIEGVLHLMRSYVEQPAPIGGGNITYFDRRDYLQRWQSILTLEEQKFMGWLDLFKKEQMGFGQTSTLVGGYASPYGRYPRYMRGRFPYVLRF